MRRPDTIRVLNELLAMHYRSLPMFLTYAAPWSAEGDGTAREKQVLDEIVADHRALSSRFAEAILERGGLIENSQFPMEFTDLHLLSLDFLIRELTAYQERDLREIERAVIRLDHDPAAKALAEEALGSARGHLENLQEATGEAA